MKSPGLHGPRHPPAKAGGKRRSAEADQQLALRKSRMNQRKRRAGVQPCTACHLSAFSEIRRGELACRAAGISRRALASGKARSGCLLGIYGVGLAGATRIRSVCEDCYTYGRGEPGRPPKKHRELAGTCRATVGATRPARAPWGRPPIRGGQSSLADRSEGHTLLAAARQLECDQLPAWCSIVFARASTRCVGGHAMPLSKPDEDDVRKIHAEVNQIVNQRFLLVICAVTAFVAIAAWQIPKDPRNVDDKQIAFMFAASVVLLAVLFVLFLLAHLLTRMLRTFTTYLDVCGKSNWEKDWAKYRKKFCYIGYTRAIAVVFLVLGVLGAAFPVVFAFMYRLDLCFTREVRGWTRFPILYVALVSTMGLGLWPWNAEKRIRAKWEKLEKLP